MNWKRMLAYVTGSVDQELLLRNQYLATENRILRQQIKGRVILSDVERFRLARIAKQLSRQALAEVAHIVRPETLLEWHRRLIAKKFDGFNNRSAVQPTSTAQEIENAWQIEDLTAAGKKLFSDVEVKPDHVHVSLYKIWVYNNSDTYNINRVATMIHEQWTSMKSVHRLATEDKNMPCRGDGGVPVSVRTITRWLELRESSFDKPRRKKIPQP